MLYVTARNVLAGPCLCEFEIPFDEFAREVRTKTISRSTITFFICASGNVRVMRTNWSPLDSFGFVICSVQSWDGRFLLYHIYIILLLAVVGRRNDDRALKLLPLLG